jgi:hypothetical protein
VTDERADFPPVQPTPEQIAERARRGDRATRGGLAAVLALEAVIVLLLPRTLARTSFGLETYETVLILVIAALLVVAAGLQRRPWGIAVGTAMQVVFLATGFLIGTMFLIGAIFIAIWLRLLQLRVEIVGSPSGWRMLGG